MSQDETVDQLVKLNRNLQYMFGHLDHDNIDRIYTNYCQVGSALGETEIDGPTLKMYGTPALEGTTSTGVLRLKMGYSTADSDFVFQLFDEAGRAAVSLNSTGQLVLSGRPLLQMYDNSTVLRLQMGQSTATNDFMFELYNAAGALTVGIDSSGEALFRGTVRSGTTDGERIEISNNSLLTYNSLNQLSGISWGSTGIFGGKYDDIYFYDAGTAVMRFLNRLSGAGYTLEPLGTASLAIGSSNNDLFIQGRLAIGSHVGFFGSAASTKVPVTTLSTAATLGQTIDKLNALVGALNGYGLV
jgi:hypothetical protein